jgi:hypothetical protein
MQNLRLGNELENSAIGFGCMHLAHEYGPSADKQGTIALMRTVSSSA